MLLVTLAVAPGIFWLWYFLQRDRLRPEPRYLVRRVFFLGGGAALAAALLEWAAFAASGIQLPPTGTASVVVAAVMIGLIEEGLKFVAVFYGVYRHAEFNEVLDGIVYAVAASLGFATVENIGYVLGGGVGVGIVRAILSVPGHAFFGALMGFYLGVAKFSGPAETRWMARGLGLAVLAHAAFDAVLLSRTLLALAVFPFILILWWRAILHTRRALALDDQRFGPTA